MSKHQKMLKSITLNFENVDYIDIPVKYIKTMHISRIKQMSHIDYDYIYDAKDRLTQQSYQEAQHFDIQIDWNYLCQQYTNFGDQGTRVKQFTDIVAIDLNYSDKTTKSIYVPWEDNNYEPDNNIYQFNDILKPIAQSNDYSLNSILAKTLDQKTLNTLKSIDKHDPFHKKDILAISVDEANKKSNINKYKLRKKNSYGKQKH